MADNLLHVKGRLNTVSSIRKITKAMKLIATSRYSRLRNLYDANWEYLNELKTCLSICLDSVEYSDFNKPTCLQENNGDKTLIIFITSTLGLSGSYYYNLQKLAEETLDKTCDCIFIGQKGYAQFSSKVDVSYTDFIDLSDSLSFKRVNKLRHYMDKLYRDNNYKCIKILYTKFNNTLSTSAECEQVLPLVLPPKEEGAGSSFNISFEGSAYQVADLIVPHYLDALLYRYFVESGISEQTSRRNSMENATTSADQLIDALNITYNKVRQSKITQEITEIVSGSEK